MIVGALYIQFDCYEAIVGRGTAKVMYKLLRDENIVRDTIVANENPLL